MLRSKSTDSESESGRESKPAFSFFSIVFEFGRRFHLVRPAARAWPRFTDQRSTLERGAETMPSHVARICLAARRVDPRHDRQREPKRKTCFGDAPPNRKSRFGGAPPNRKTRFGDASPNRKTRSGDASPERKTRVHACRHADGAWAKVAPGQNGTCVRAYVPTEPEARWPRAKMGHARMHTCLQCLSQNGAEPKWDMHACIHTYSA